MEFPFLVSKLFKPNADGLAVLNCRPLKSGLSTTLPGLPPRPGGNSDSKLSSSELDHRNMEHVIDTMGALSCKAQDLKVPITSYLKVSGTDSRIYMKIEGKVLSGFLKVGKKRLFFHDKNGIMKEMNPLCVLDFYVHESMQRSGVGKWLFEHMLELENAKPVQLAYDRPSPKLLGFLRKHYNLASFIPQNNNYVIFQATFEAPKPMSAGKRGRDFSEEQKSASSFFKAGQSILGAPPPMENAPTVTTTTMGYVPMYQKKQHSTAGYVDPRERTIQDQIKHLEDKVKVLNTAATTAANRTGRDGRGTTPIDQLDEVTRAPKGRSYSSNGGMASLLFPGRK